MLQDLFVSRNTRIERERIRFRQTQIKLRRRVDKLMRAADRYWDLASKAHSLQSHEQFAQLGGHYLRLLNAVRRWNCIMLKLESIELRRDEVIATTELLEGLDAINQVIMQGAGPEDVAKMRANLEIAMEKSRATELELDEFMEATGAALQDDASPAAISELDRLFEGQHQTSLGITNNDGQTFEEAMRKLQESTGKIPQ